jgi:hypothetical protein
LQTEKLCFVNLKYLRMLTNTNWAGGELNEALATIKASGYKDSTNGKGIQIKK